MIYEQVGRKPIRQGDIFRAVPRVEVSLSQLAVLEDTRTTRTTWQELLRQDSSRQGVVAVLPIKPVTGVVVTQDCDATRGEYIYLAEVTKLETAANLKNLPSKPAKWVNQLRRISDTNPRLFYLPEAPEFELEDRSAADFRVLLRVSRLDLEDMRDRRVGRLNAVAREHFREALGHFFRRYALNAWYPFTKEEFQAYAADCPEEVEAYPWQE